MLQQLYWTPWDASSVQKAQPARAERPVKTQEGWVKQKGRSPEGTPPPCEAMA
jgi:hypothetical protein